MLVNFAADMYMNKMARDAVIANRDAQKNASLLDYIADFLGIGSRSAEKI